MNETKQAGAREQWRACVDWKDRPLHLDTDEVATASGAPVCRMTGDVADAYPNARLIAAAPDLLAVCQEIAEHETDDWDARMETLRAAIAKAEGRQS